MTKEEMFDYIKAHSIPCPNCGKHNFTDIREFNLMFQTYRGVTNDAKSIAARIVFIFLFYCVSQFIR